MVCYPRLWAALFLRMFAAGGESFVVAAVTEKRGTMEVSNIRAGNESSQRFKKKMKQKAVSTEVCSITLFVTIEFNNALKLKFYLLIFSASPNTC